MNNETIRQEITKLLDCNLFTPGQAFDALCNLRRDRVTLAQLKAALSGDDSHEPLDQVNANGEYTDDTPFPFGKYKGVPISDIDAGYLHWLWCNRPIKHGEGKKIEAYIVKNMDALKEENPDAIWS